MSEMLLTINVFKKDNMLFINQSYLRIEQTKTIHSYRGLRFESICTTDKPGSIATNANEVHAENNFSVIVFSKILENKLFCIGEVDCIIFSNKNFLCLEDFVELKTSTKFPLIFKDAVKIKKYIKWYLQAYLIGIKNLKIGIIDKHGFTSKIIDSSIDDIYIKYRDIIDEKILFLNSLLVEIKTHFLLNKNLDSCVVILDKNSFKIKI